MGSCSGNLSQWNYHNQANVLNSAFEQISMVRFIERYQFSMLIIFSIGFILHAKQFLVLLFIFELLFYVQFRWIQVPNRRCNKTRMAATKRIILDRLSL